MMITVVGCLRNYCNNYNLSLSHTGETRKRIVRLAPLIQSIFTTFLISFL